MAFETSGVLLLRAMLEKTVQEIMDSFVLAIEEALDRSLQKFGFSGKNNKDLPEASGKEAEALQDKITMAETDVGINQVNGGNIPIQVIEQETALLMQVEKLNGNRFLFEGQRNELFDHPSKKSQKAGLKLAKRISRRKRAYRIYQPHINVQNFSGKIQMTPVMLKKLWKMKNWKRYRKKVV